MKLREPTNNEFPELQTAGWFRVLDEGQVTGHVACSIIHDLPFIHELKYWGSNPSGVLKLCSAARKQIKDWGYTEIYCNIDPGFPALLKPLIEHGFEVAQIILKGEL